MLIIFSFIENILCGFTVLSKGSFFFSNASFVICIPSLVLLLVIRQQILSSPFRLVLDIISAGLFLAPVKSEYGKGIKTMSRWL